MAADKNTGWIFFFSPPPSLFQLSLFKSAKNFIIVLINNLFIFFILVSARANAAQQWSSGIRDRSNIGIQQKTLCSGSMAGVESSHKGLSITVTPVKKEKTPSVLMRSSSFRAGEGDGFWNQEMEEIRSSHVGTTVGTKKWCQTEEMFIFKVRKSANAKYHLLQVIKGKHAESWS